MSLVDRGSQTAKDGFKNEEDIIKKFNDWEKDKDAQTWLISMKYKFSTSIAFLSFMVTWT